MDDYSHIGYHRGNWFAWFFGALGLMVLIAGGIALFSRVGMHDSSGSTKLPPDWPQLGYAVDADASDIWFDPDIRRMGGALRLVAQKSSKAASVRNSEPLAWNIYFNHPLPPEQFLASTDQQLQAAGWSNGGGRTMEYFPQTGLLDLVFTDPQGKYTMLVRYWATAPMNYGNVANDQHWHVMIQKKRY